MSTARQRLRAALSSAQSMGASIAVLTLDLDYFAVVNEIWGPEAGDAVLREIAGVLTQSLSGEDFVTRYAGEKFVVLLRGADLDSGRVVAEALRAAIAAHPFEWESEPIRVTVSVGVAVGSSDSDLVALADARMCAAKRQGRNRVVSAGFVPI